MSLARMQKVVFFTRPGELQRLMDVLQASASVQLVESDAVLPSNAEALVVPPVPGPDLNACTSALEHRIQEIESAIAVLARYEEQGGLAHRLLPQHPVTSLTDFNAFAHYDETPVTTALAAAAVEERETHAQLETVRRQQTLLEPLAGLDLPLEQLADTRHCFIKVFSAARAVLPSLGEELAERLGATADLRTLTATPDRVVACVIGRARQRAAYEEWAESQPITPIDLAGLRGSAPDTLAQLAEEEAALARRFAEIDARRAALAARLPALREADDYLRSRLEQLKKTTFLRASRYTSIVGGWTRADDVAPLEERFVREGLDVCTVAADPAPGDEPPVEYANARLVRPFEFISDLYSRPRPGETDPTPFLAGFFAFFVSLCLTDAGYGLVLAIGTFLLLRRAPGLSGGSRKLVWILFICALCTVAVGLLTGGIFGLAPKDLPAPLAWLDRLVVLSPMENQMGFLVLTLALGIVHVALGITLKLQWNLRHGHKAEALLDQAPWLLLIAGAVSLALSGRVGPVWLGAFGTGALIVAGAVILLFAGRDASNPFRRLAAGLFSLYQVSGLFGDVLSYVRLFALGLATGVIASVVNFIAQLVLGVPYVGFVLMLLVLVFGHLVNIAINTLGGFIHTTRLQFVEFFGKFYQGGGKPFDAFQLKTRYTTVTDLAQ